MNPILRMLETSRTYLMSARAKNQDTEPERLARSKTGNSIKNTKTSGEDKFFESLAFLTLMEMEFDD